MNTNVNWGWIAITLSINIVISILAYLLIIRVILKMKPMFIKARIFGIDMNKPNVKSFEKSGDSIVQIKIPEAQGVVAGCIYLIVMFLFIPIAFYDKFDKHKDTTFPFDEYVKYLSGLLSICCMIFLGFADDVLDLRWRHKLLLPTIASLPLLVVYFVSFDLTHIIVPVPFRDIVGFSVDIGIFYYIYMGMLAIFCTNSINILAGVNGLEAGQSLIIVLTVIVFNIIEISGSHTSSHLFSLYFMIPFLSVCASLLKFNWYPAEIFVGDTFCYFAGMTFSVVAILGHFSKTMLLFFIPQTINFLISCPQLFHFLPCPRHRLPRLNSDGLLDASCFTMDSGKPTKLQTYLISILCSLGIIKTYVVKKEDKLVKQYTNLTLINFLLNHIGPTKESSLTIYIMIIQTLCSIIAMGIRYPLAKLMYNR